MTAEDDCGGKEQRFNDRIRTAANIAGKRSLASFGIMSVRMQQLVQTALVVLCSIAVIFVMSSAP